MVTPFQVKNILVGAGHMYLNPTNSTAFDSSQFTDVGFTVDGVEISLEPDIIDVMVDQLGDAAKVIHNTTKVMLKTTLAEATLENLAVAWGYAGTTSVTANNQIFAANITGDGLTTDKVFNWAAFPSSEALEKSARFQGHNPQGFPRTYTCTRVVQVNASAHSYKRGAATLYPCEFRILPNSANTGFEYGTIVDSWSAFA